MALTDAQIAANIERRRSERWPLAMPVIVSGVSLDSKPFHEDTITLSVSTHGALVALMTTVTLGQTLYIRNPQTQTEAGAWVTRFGHPRGGLSQVGIEFVQPDEKFWSNKADVKLSYDAARSAVQEAGLDLPETSPDGSSGAQISPSGTPPTSTVAPGILLHALEQTLRQAAEKAVATAAGASLGSAVNHALAAIDDFSRDRLRQMEESLAVYRSEMMALAREELFSQVQADLIRAEEQFRKRAAEFIKDAARDAQRDFATRLSDNAHLVALQFAEDAIGASANHFARLSDQMQSVASQAQAQAQIENKTAEFNQTREKAADELGRTVGEAEKKIESLTTLLDGAHSRWEASLRAFQDELGVSQEHEIERFRGRLRSVLTNLLSGIE